VMSYRGSLREHAEHNLGRFSGSLAYWIELGVPGICPRVRPYLNSIKLRQHRVGEAVSTFDPNFGPFTDFELGALISAARQSYEAGEFNLSDYSAFSLLVALGVRPLQLALLKCCDLEIGQSSKSDKAFLLHVPRVKQPGYGGRELMKPRMLPDEVGKVLEQHIALHQGTVSNSALPQFPIFPGPKQETGISGFDWHIEARVLAERLARKLTALGVISERTGKPLQISLRRFRYTFGTRAAEEGFPLHVIAEMMDHTSIYSAQVYVKATDKMAHRVTLATIQELAPIAQAFLGTLIDDPENAIRAGETEANISAGGVEGVGTCGHFGFCDSLPPVACYTCRYFQPWVDAPHDKLLEKLISERERILAETGDNRVASANDRTMLAIAEVVRLCEEAHGNRA
jgi:integrase